MTDEELLRYQQKLVLIYAGGPLALGLICLIVAGVMAWWQG